MPPATSSPSRAAPPAPLGDALRRHWMLSPGLTFLNHGSFGAVPRPVRAAYLEIQERIEADPIEWLDRRLGDLLHPARAKVASFLGVEPDALGFVTNATEGVNAVLRSLEFAVGDELLTTSHVYNAVRNAMRFRAHQTGARYVEVPLPLPVHAEDAVVAALVGAMGPRTRLVVVDQVTSPTALVFPVERLASECRARGIELLVDGAHAPGMLELDVDALGCTYWTGNLHKWCGAPKGAAVLWAAPERRAEIHPLGISHFLDQGFAREFDWQGTRDPAAWAVTGHGLAFYESFGWDRVRAHNRALAAFAHDLWCERWGVEPIAPREPAPLAFMATVPLPEALAERYGTPLALQRALHDEDRIEVPIVPFDGRWHARASAQLYNLPADYERLAEAIRRRAGMG